MASNKSVIILIMCIKSLLLVFNVHTTENVISITVLQYIFLLVIIIIKKFNIIGTATDPPALKQCILYFWEL